MAASMHVKDCLKEAIQSIAGVRLRSILALTGIVVGIAAVITIISVGEIVKKVSLERFTALGTDIVRVNLTPNSGFRSKSVKLEDFSLLAVEAPEIEASAPWMTWSVDLRYAGKRVEDLIISSVGVTDSFQDLYQLTVAEGRFVSRLDHRKLYCVLGADVADALRAAGAGEVLGNRINMLGQFFEVVGILERAADGAAYSEFHVDQSIFIPISTQLYLDRSRRPPRVIARKHADVPVEAASQAIVSFFTARIPRVTVSVRSPLQLIAQMEEQRRLLTFLLVAIGSISLIIGGVGIMNVMIMSVTERRAEVGLRRAIGARRRDIRRQFVSEAVALCLVGGLLGILVGILASYIVCMFAGWPFRISTTAAVIGVAVSTGVGVLFGFLPAQQAARLDPIAALRV